MKRMFDIVMAVTALVALWPVLLEVTLAVKLASFGSVLYWLLRVGCGNRIFRMPKFSSIRIDAPPEATHLLQDSGKWFKPNS